VSNRPVAHLQRLAGSAHTHYGSKRKWHVRVLPVVNTRDTFSTADNADMMVNIGFRHPKAP
jgi:hypothetical protein